MMALSSVSVIPAADALFDRKPAYSLDQLEPIALVTADPTILVVHPSLPVKSVKELVALGRAKQGQLSYSTSGIYGALHMPMEMFLHAAKLKMRAVHTTGGGPAITSVLGGHVDMTAGGPAAITAQVKAGKLRPIASWGAKRHPNFPDVPTFKELGYDIEYYIWAGLFGPRGHSRSESEGAARCRAQGRRRSRLQERDGQGQLADPVHGCAGIPQVLARPMRSGWPRW